MNTIKKGTTRKGDTVLLQELLRHAGYTISVDGDFGPGTDRAVRDFQKKNGLEADGVVGSKTWMKFTIKFPTFFEKLVSKFLTEKDIEKAAKDLGVEVAAVKAVREVEAKGTGFWGEQSVILFERHIFWKQLKAQGLNPQKFKAGNEDILSAKPGGYLGGTREYGRLDRAKKINENAALESASWGMFQIMGFHWKNLGYPSVKQYVKLMQKNEGEHLKAFVKFVQTENLARFLKNKDWAGFARRYNGPAFKKNKYDEKLAAAYAKFSA